MKKTPLRVAVFASGAGSNALQLLDVVPELKRTTIPLVIVDQSDSLLPQKIRNRFPSVEVKVIPYTGSKRIHEELILQCLTEHQIDWIFLAGYMRILGPTLLHHFKNAKGTSRIVNIHPSLLPAYPGLESYRQAFNANERESGITLHLVDAGTDTGPILLQHRFDRRKNDDLESFSQRGKELEWKLYPELLKKLDHEGTLHPLQKNRAFIAIPTHREKKLSVFWLHYSGSPIESSDLQKLAPTLSDEVDQQLWINPSEKQWHTLDFARLQVVYFKPGVTDNPAQSFKELLEFESLFLGRGLTVHSGEVILHPSLSDAQAPFNRLIQESREGLHLDQIQFLEPKTTPATVETFSLSGLTPTELKELSDSRFWALTADEMVVIKKHYGDQSATDVEMEVLAQTWSEHCKHKIFAATIDYEDSHEKFQVKSLFKTYIEKPTHEFQEKKDWAISVFKDNAGIVRFHDDVDLCIKVETHNSPSALDPYGGALTGILGVNRDILGTGLGARPIANTNVLLFGNPHEKDPLPKGLFHPRDILAGVHHGIQDGGNKSGIPTVNGAMIFDESFSGKPLVYCGTVGVLPRQVGKFPSASKNQRPGDLIVMVGGAVGADGLHGATSSSLAMDHTTPSSMVQIGDPLTQKRVLDFVLEARDLELYNSITDNGAGGLSSSIGEMSELPGGAEVYLDRVPLKYPGLLPWQILVSESQERMTLSVPKENVDALIALAISRGVEATVVGEFTNSGYFEAYFEEQIVSKLSLQFLHSGLPKMQLKAKWAGPQKRVSWKGKEPLRPALGSFAQGLETLLRDPSIASKEKWIRQYDHEVQGGTAIKPFEGMKHTAPNDGGLIWMGAHGNRGFSGVGIASGLCPDVSLMDAGLMAKIAADEAVRNLMVMGVDPNHVALIDNFCWPDPLPGPRNPDAEHKLAQLVRACKSLADLVRVYGMPLVSGKDSMKNDFVNASVKISVLPTLLVTAMGYHPDVRTAVKSHAKPGDFLYLLTTPDACSNHSAYFGTTLAKYFDLESMNALPQWSLSNTRAMYEKLFEATKMGWIQSAHDLSEGGLLVALFETLLLHRAGLSVTLPHGVNETSFCFGEFPGRILVSVNSKDISNFETHFGPSSFIRLGETNSTGTLKIHRRNSNEECSIDTLSQIWRNVL